MSQLINTVPTAFAKQKSSMGTQMFDQLISFHTQFKNPLFTASTRNGQRCRPSRNAAHKSSRAKSLPRTAARRSAATVKKNDPPGT